jgi:hypothetical protein
VSPFYSLDLNQFLQLFCIKSEIFLGKSLVVREKVVPLHPLLRGTPLGALVKSSLKDLHKQEVVVQEASAL